MKNNEYSFEDFFGAGTGNETQESYKISTEGFDGYNDELSKDLQESIEQMNFLDAYSTVDKMNSDQKIRMLKKIQNNYNSKTISRENLGYSIESYTNQYIRSQEGVISKFCGFIKSLFKIILNIIRSISIFITQFISKISKNNKNSLESLNISNSELNDVIIDFSDPGCSWSIVCKLLNNMSEKFHKISQDGINYANRLLLVSKNINVNYSTQDIKFIIDFGSNCIIEMIALLKVDKKELDQIISLKNNININNPGDINKYIKIMEEKVNQLVPTRKDYIFKRLNLKTIKISDLLNNKSDITKINIDNLQDFNRKCSNSMHVHYLNYSQMNKITDKISDNLTLNQNALNNLILSDKLYMLKFYLSLQAKLYNIYELVLMTFAKSCSSIIKLQTKKNNSLESYDQSQEGLGSTIVLTYCLAESLNLILGNSPLITKPFKKIIDKFKEKNNAKQQNTHNTEYQERVRKEQEAYEVIKSNPEIQKLGSEAKKLLEFSNKFGKEFVKSFKPELSKIDSKHYIDVYDMEDDSDQYAEISEILLNRCAEVAKAIENKSKIDITINFSTFMVDGLKQYTLDYETNNDEDNEKFNKIYYETIENTCKKMKLSIYNPEKDDISKLKYNTPYFNLEWEGDHHGTIQEIFEVIRLDFSK